ncbi:hypothetical protein EVAR_29085_1 [Eumeta japonica]|uniref:Uncharacterized protein n=1 Tax=Eumeta variegata TaxID=151549 RepID=A0A4C1VQ02_EUMVA|nr:hypothetical protein EVAR_29085_1 [Eumeta japonica]
MSIPHTLALVRSNDWSDDRSDDYDSFAVRGRTARVSADRRVTCPMDDSWRLSSRHRMSSDTVTGRFPFLRPCRERSAGAGWSKGYRSMT